MSKDKIPVALLLNDIHISKDNIPEFQKNWGEVLQLCADRHISNIIIGGDLWQSRSAQTLDVLMAVRQAIIKATRRTFSLIIAEGNHCKVDQESVLGYSHLFSEYPNVYVVDDYTVFDVSKAVALYVMSYFPENGSFEQRLKKMIADELDESKTNLLYIHEGINGALSTANDKELPTNIFKDFDKVLVGHYHNRCVIKGTNIEYIGASRQHNFGEDEEKGYTILYADGSYDFVKNKVNTRYKVLDVAMSQLDTKFLERLDDLRATGMYKVKARVSCSSSEANTVNKQKLLESGATKVEIIAEENDVISVAHHALDKKFDKSGIKQEYTAFCADKGIDDVDMGLEYLDKIK